jgi:hypothetical protein
MNLNTRISCYATSSFPRKRESRVSWWRRLAWTPAFAGVTRATRHNLRPEGKAMQKHLGWLWIVGFSNLVAAANAQTPSPSGAGTQFDGTYAFVSSTKVNEIYRDFHNRDHQCPDASAGPLTVVNGQARYTGRGGREFEGTIGSRGELAMQSTAAAALKKDWLPSVIMVSGSIDDNGTIRARRTSWYCRHDFIWQKDQSRTAH